MISKLIEKLELTDKNFVMSKEEKEILQDIEKSLTHTRPEPLEEAPTERQMNFTPEQEKARQAAKNGELGIKFDEEKTRFDLLPWNEIKQVADVFTLGAKKYADDNWKFVLNAEKRYFSAALRHLVAWKEGEKYDKESGISHLAHAICCCLFLLNFDNERDRNNK